MRKSGVYKITCLPNGKFYIGSAASLRRRKIEHFSKLNVGRHCNTYIQRSYNKYGKPAFIFEIIEYCSVDLLIKREQHYLNTLLFAQEYLKGEDKRFRKFGFNICAIASSVLGITRSEATRKKISVANSGKNHYKYGKALDENHKQKLSAALKGRSVPAWKKELLSKTRVGEGNPMYGKAAANRKVTYSLNLYAGTFNDFPSAKDAADFYNIDPRKLNECIKKSKLLNNLLFFY